MTSANFKVSFAGMQKAKNGHYNLFKLAPKGRWSVDYVANTLAGSWRCEFPSKKAALASMEKHYMKSKTPSFRQKLQALKNVTINGQMKYATAPIDSKNLYAVARGEGIQQAYAEIIGSFDMLLATYRGKKLRTQAENLLSEFGTTVAALNAWSKSPYYDDSLADALQAERYQQQHSVYKMAYADLLRIVKPEQETRRNNLSGMTSQEYDEAQY